MRQIGKARPLALLAMIAAVVTGTLTRADDQTGCLFKGELMRADDYATVTVFRHLENDAPVEAFPHIPLFPGDRVIIKSKQNVFVRNAPGSRPKRITEKDSPFVIEGAASCAVDTSIWGKAGAFIETVRIWAGGPVEALPEPTHARGDATDEKEIGITFVDGQQIPTGLGGLSVHWFGPTARVQIVSGTKTVHEIPEGDGLMAHLPLDEVPSGDFTIELSTLSQKKEVRLSKVGADTAPGYALFGDVASLSGQSATLYGLWLLENAPMEWYLLAYSLISDQAENNYMAWKIWRKLTAQKP